jgi:hypothetical protein
MHTTSHHTARTVVGALALSAVLAPAASAQQDLRSPDTQDFAAGRGLERAPVVEFVDVPHADGFDWTDAALGAATAFGIILVGTGGAIATVRVRRRPLGA